MEARSDYHAEAKIRCGIRRWNRENGSAPVGGEEGNVAEGEQAAEGYHHRDGTLSVPIEDYIVYIHNFSGAREPDLRSPPNIRKIPRKQSKVDGKRPGRRQNPYIQRASVSILRSSISFESNHRRGAFKSSELAQSCEIECHSILQSWHNDEKLNVL
jgi:hypothetical protein